MCFGGGNKQVKPEPTYPVRFAYNQPTGNQSDTQRQQMAAANGTQPAFGAELGSTPKPPLMQKGTY